MGIVSLIGLSGCGKTTVAGLVASHLRWGLVDLDREVELRSGTTIATLFSEEGEVGFRQREAVALTEALSGDDRVIATGGGAPCQSGAMDALLEAGQVVWLQASVSVLLERTVDRGHRPLLSIGDGARETLVQQLSDREPFYARAHLAVQTDGLSPEAVAERITRYMLNHQGAA